MEFRYQARTKEGKIKTGVIKASSREAALSILQKYGFFVTTLKPTKPPPLLSRRIKLFEKTSLRDIVNFTRQLSIMFKSKVPLVDALRALALQWKKPDFRKKIMKISEETEGGAPLSQAFSLYPGLFSPFYIAMVKSGEASGKLAESLSYLADYLERRYNLRAKMKGAAFYPLFVLIVIFIIITLMIFFVFPRLSAVLKKSGQELPVMTKLVLGGAAFLREWGWLVLIGIIGSIFGLVSYLKTESGKKLWDRISLKIPILGGFFKKIYLSRFARNLSTLIKGGLPIAQALEITGDVVNNTIYRKIILETRDEVRKGEAINVVLSRFPQYIPPLVIQMITVGEKTGTLDQTLTHVVEFYQDEVDRFMDNIVNLMEPILIAILGAVVAIIVLTVFMPLYQMRMGVV